MPLLISQDILGSINKEIEKCNESFIVISAFCKLSLIKYFDSRLSSRVSEKKLIVRMKPEDVIKGATDLELYDYCKENGWTLYFKLDLHAKTYVFDHVRCIVGSANATTSGLSVGGVGNYEMAATNSLDEEDRKVIAKLVDYSVRMSDEIYQIMKDCIASYDGLKDLDSIKWPEEITRYNQLDFSVLFTEDFPSERSPFSVNESEFNYWDDISKITKKEAMYTLNYILVNSMKLLHPFMPFITEEIYTTLCPNEESIMISAWPTEKEELNFKNEEEQIEEPEIIEIPAHKFFIAGQFHPEFKSRPFAAAPLFDALVKVCLD